MSPSRRRYVPRLPLLLAALLAPLGCDFQDPFIRGLFANVDTDLLRTQYFVTGGNAQRAVILRAQLPEFDSSAAPPEEYAPTQFDLGVLDVATLSSRLLEVEADTAALMEVTDGQSIAWVVSPIDHETGQSAGGPDERFVAVLDIDSGATTRYFEGLTVDDVAISSVLGIDPQHLVLLGSADDDAAAWIILDRGTGERRVLPDAPPAWFGQFRLRDGQAYAVIHQGPAEGDPATGNGPAGFYELLRVDLARLNREVLLSGLTDVGEKLALVGPRLVWQESTYTSDFAAVATFAVRAYNLDTAQTETILSIDDVGGAPGTFLRLVDVGDAGMILERTSFRPPFASDVALELAGFDGSSRTFFSYTSELTRLALIPSDPRIFGSRIIWRDPFDGHWLAYDVQTGQTQSFDLFGG